MEPNELYNRFAYHAPSSEDVRMAHEFVRNQHYVLATVLNDKLPEGREKALAVTKLEEAMFWANAAIARNV